MYLGSCYQIDDYYKFNVAKFKSLESNKQVDASCSDILTYIVAYISSRQKDG